MYDQLEMNQTHAIGFIEQNPPDYSLMASAKKSQNSRIMIKSIDAFDFS